MEPEQRKTPTPLGYHLLRAMSDAGYERVAPFARAAGVSGSTMHRVIYGGSGRPDPETLLLIAQALARGSDGTDAERLTVEAIHQELMSLAGYTIGRAAPVHTYDPVALKLDHAIQGSTLSQADRDLLRTMVDRLIDDTLRRGRRRAG